MRLTECENSNKTIGTHVGVVVYQCPQATIQVTNCSSHEKKKNVGYNTKHVMEIKLTK